MKTLISKKLKSGLFFPIELYDEKKNRIYYEDSDGYWAKWEYDERGNPIYFENSEGYWWKREYDENGNETYYENSNGGIIDKRPKTINRVKQRKAYQLELVYGVIG